MGILKIKQRNVYIKKERNSQRKETNKQTKQQQLDVTKRGGKQ